MKEQGPYIELTIHLNLFYCFGMLRTGMRLEVTCFDHISMFTTIWGMG